MKYRHKSIVFAAVCSFLIGLFAVIPQSVRAESVKLSVGKTYTRYDVTNDGTADSIKVKIYKTDSDEYYDGVQIYVNGKKAYSAKDQFYHAYARIQYSDSGTEYLELWTSTDGDGVEFHKLLKYKSGKLKSVLNLCRVQGFGTIEKIQKDKIKVSYQHCYYTTIGLADFEYTYTNHNGKWTESKYGTNPAVYVQNSTKTTTKLTAAKSFKTYSTVGGKTVAFTVHKGNTVQVKKCRVYKYAAYIQLKCGSKTGWIKGEPNTTDLIFENTVVGG